MSTANVEGRIYFYDTGDPFDIEVWKYELEPMDGMGRSSADWAREHLCECHTDEDLREMFDLPEDGNWQVIFKGTLRGFRCGNPMDGEDWDEEFEVDECQSQRIPDDSLEFFLPKKVQG